MKKALIYICVALGIIAGLYCWYMRRHEFTFDIRDHAQKIDAHFVEVDFTPYTAVIKVTGELSKDAKLIGNIVYSSPSSQSGQLAPTKIALPKGKVNVEQWWDFYGQELNFIYVPLQDSTYGNLKVQVSVY